MKTDMTSTLTNALSGLHAGIHRARMASKEVAKLTTGSDTVRDAVKPLLALQQVKQETAVTSKVVKTENATLGRFIDERV